MIQIRSHTHALVALMLTLALVAMAGPWAVLAQDEDGAETAAAAEESEASPGPTAEPTPYPAFDPSSVRLRLERFADGFDSPVYIADDGIRQRNGGCRYVVERGGLVRIILPDRTTPPQPFLDIRKLVQGAESEQGLHSIAFHPGFRKNGRFFVRYTTAENNNIVEEYQGKPCGRANPKPKKTWLNETQEYINNNGGWIGFGPDGKLYVTTGDGGGGWPGDPKGLGQTPSTLLGKVLRLDVQRSNGIAPDNPYVKTKKKNGKVKLRPRQRFNMNTWAYGLRDPRRASFDRKTGDLWIGDQGQDRFEEINRIPEGETKKQRKAFNFGWSDVVGTDTCHVNQPDCDPAQYDPPVHTYDHVAPHRGVTGGYVYRGERLPKLDGVYLFSDVTSGYIWGLDADAIGKGLEVPAHLLLDAPYGIVSFGEDDEGDLYVVSLEGTIDRIDLS